MSRYKLKLKPQGAIARDTSLTIQMQPIVVATPTVDEVIPPPPLLHINIGFDAVIGENRYSWVSVWTDDVQEADLPVTITYANPAIVNVLSGSMFASTATKSILAGQRYVNFFLHYLYAAPGSSLVTAAAAGYDDATATVSTACDHALLGVRYELRSIDATTSVAQASDNVTSALTISKRRAAFITGVLDITERCAEDVITWTVTGTAPGVIVDAYVGTPLQIQIMAPGDLLGGTANAPGDTIIVTCKVNGTTAGLPFAVFTFTF